MRWEMKAIISLTQKWEHVVMNDGLITHTRLSPVDCWHNPGNLVVSIRLSLNGGLLLSTLIQGALSGCITFCLSDKKVSLLLGDEILQTLLMLLSQIFKSILSHCLPTIGRCKMPIIKKIFHSLQKYYVSFIGLGLNWYSNFIHGF